MTKHYRMHYSEPKPRRRTIPPALRLRVLQADEYTCQYCGARAPGVTLHVDHRLPVAMGGTNARGNLVTACEECNLGKGSQLGILTPEKLDARNELICAVETEMQAVADDPEFWPPLPGEDVVATDPDDCAWLEAHCGATPEFVL